MTFIPIIISIVSLMISIVTAFRSWWVERFNLDFDMIKWFGGSPKEYPFFIWLSITNYSKLPCSILEIKIENTRSEETFYASGYGESKLVCSTKSNYSEPKSVYSFSYPVNISPYNSIGGYFHVFSDYSFSNYEEDIVKITVRTNRGSITKKIYMDYGKNIFRVLQFKNEDIKITHHSNGSPINYLKDTI